MRANFKNYKTVLFLILFLGLVLRLINIDSKSVFMDEKILLHCAYGFSFADSTNPLTIKTGISFSVYVDRQPCKDSLTKSIDLVCLEDKNKINNVINASNTGNGGNNIIYLLTLGYWTNIFGRNIVSSHFFSAFWGILLLIMLYIYEKFYKR